MSNKELDAAAKDIRAIISGLQSFEGDAKKILQGLAALKTKLESFKVQTPNLQKAKWLKTAEAAGADKKILQALKEAQSSGSKASCEAALRLVKGEKSLKVVADSLQKLLDEDRKQAKELTQVLEEAKGMVAEVDKLDAATTSFPADFTKQTQACAELVKEIKLVKAKNAKAA